MNKCRAPKISPLLVNNLFILNCTEKSRYFNDYFSLQYTPVINNSVLPIFRFLTNKRIDNVTIGNDEIISLIRKINPNKATGSDGISGQILLLCDKSLILEIFCQPLYTLICVLSTSIYPDMCSVNLYIPWYVVCQHLYTLICILSTSIYPDMYSVNLYIPWYVFCQPLYTLIPWVFCQPLYTLICVLSIPLWRLTLYTWYSILYICSTSIYPDMCSVNTYQGI